MILSYFIFKKGLSIYICMFIYMYIMREDILNTKEYQRLNIKRILKNKY